MVQPKDIDVPFVSKRCCGKTYDTVNPRTAPLFRAFFHKNFEKSIDARLCLTIWFVCANNNCFHAFTFYYNKEGKLVNMIEHNKIKYLAEIQKGFIEAARIKQKPLKKYDVSKKYLWKYGKSTNGKTQNIYDFNDIKVNKEYSDIKISS